MEIDKINVGKYTTYKTKETSETEEAEKTNENQSTNEEMQAVANKFYADVTAQSTDEDPVIELDESNVADSSTYQKVKDYVNTQGDE